MSALLRIPVGVVVERQKASSQWVDFTWKAVSLFVGEPQAEPWTKVKEDGDAATFYAGRATVELHAADTLSYVDNITAPEPKAWVVLRPTNAQPPFEIVCVTVDGSAAENFTSAGNDLVDSVAMPEAVLAAVDAFVGQHHVETPFYKRQRTKNDPEAMGRRRKGAKDKLLKDKE